MEITVHHLTVPQPMEFSGMPDCLVAAVPIVMALTTLMKFILTDYS